MLVATTMTANGQTTVPQGVRAAMKIGPGDQIAWEVNEAFREL